MFGAAWALLLAACASSGAAPKIAPPTAAPTEARGADHVHNVLLVVIDTLRADHLSCYGYPRGTSPNIDRFAAGAVRFERAYTAWPETCQSMAAILSGTWCQTNGVVIDTPQAISTEIDLLPELLQRQGFRTAAFVTNRVLPRSNRFDQGIADYVEIWDETLNPERRNETELARAWLRENVDRKFFLWVHLMEPHAPYRGRIPDRFVGDPWYDPSRRVEVRPPERRFDGMGGIPGVNRVEGHDELAYYVARYDSDVYDADAKFGALLAELDALELADRTLVILVADHGEGLGEHDYFWHGHVPFDETARVPLVIRAPGFEPGVAADVVSTVDLVPTILELAGFELPALLEGRTLVPILRDPGLRTDRVVFMESGDDRRKRSWQRTARDARYKLVWTPSPKERERLGLDEWSLFDLVEDPGETRNVVVEHVEAARRLHDELFAWLRLKPLFRAPAATLHESEAEAIRATGYAVEDEQVFDGDE
jgi:arylsulfatase A-like enzyme